MTESKTEARAFAEIGVGNESFLSTEFECGDEEFRVGGFVKPDKVDDYYLRIWILRKVIIFSSAEGIKLKKKPRIQFKLLLGMGGKINKQRLLNYCNKTKL